ncbi:MAG: hypothetical protein O7A09_10110, partial [Proteobacteria bacterium]|nr:hypothetical protein [Pseudomonadota bacterium]
LMTAYEARRSEEFPPWSGGAEQKRPVPVLSDDVIRERAQLRASIDATELAVSTGETFRKPAGTPLRLQMQASLDGDTVTLSDGTFTLANAEVAYEGTVTTAPTVAYDLHLRSQSLPLSGWESILPALADLVLAGEADVDLRVAGSVEQAGLPPLYGTVSLRDLTVRVDGVPELTKLSAAIQLEGDRATLPKSTLELGGSPLELEATVANFDAPDLTFAVTSKVLQASSIQLGDPHSVNPEVLRGVELRGTASLPAGAGLRLKADLRSSDGSIRDLDYRDLRADFVYRDERATLENASLRALDGELSLVGVYDLRDPETPAFELRTTAVEIRLEQALASQFPGAARVIEGRLSGDIDLTGRGSEWDVIKQFLRGGGTLELEAGVLRGINLAESVLTSVSVVPVLGKLTSAPIKTAYPAIFGEPNTVFETIGGKIEIADGRLHTPNLRFKAADYKIRADGSISFEADVSLTGTFIAGKRLTDHLIGRAGPLRHLTGGSGKIQIPFRLEGPATRLKVRPDVHYVTKALRRGLQENLVGQAVKGLEGLLQKK